MTGNTTKIKLCGLSHSSDIEAANTLKPDYIGFVFAKGSRRYITPQKAAEIKEQLHPEIQAVGVFVNEAPENILKLIQEGIIDTVQLHGCEDEAYINRLKALTDCPIIKAFFIKAEQDILTAESSSADFILLDSGSGTGRTFNWELMQNVRRPYFLAGGLTPENVGDAVLKFQPFAVDASSSLETEGQKDKSKMTAFINAVRGS